MKATLGLLTLLFTSGCLWDAHWDAHCRNYDQPWSQYTVGESIVRVSVLVATVLAIGFFVGTGWGRSGR